MPKARARPDSTSKKESAWSLPNSMLKFRFFSVLYLRSTCRLVVPVVVATFLPARSA